MSGLPRCVLLRWSEAGWSNGWAPSRVAPVQQPWSGPGGGAGRGTAKTASMRASFRAIHGAQRPRPAPPPGPLTGSGRRHPRIKRRKAVAPTHGRRAQRAVGGNIPPTMGRRYRRFHGRHGPVEGGAGWVGGGVERHGWRETRPAGAALAVPRQATPPRQPAALQLLTLTLLEKAERRPQAPSDQPCSSEIRTSRRTRRRSRC